MRVQRLSVQPNVKNVAKILEVEDKETLTQTTFGRSRYENLMGLVADDIAGHS
jgi:hypothetical protein